MDPILKAAQAVAKFASKHAVLTAAAVTTAGVGGYIAYDNYRGADDTNGGAFVKQDVAVNDKNGDLRMKMQGLKDAAKANEPAKSDAKTDNGDTSKKLKEALDAAKDADIKAEAAKTSEPKVEGAPETEKPYIPETAAANDDASANLLNGSGSAAFKTAHFASSGDGSAAYEPGKGGQTSGETTTGGASNGSSVKVSKSHGDVGELDPKASATTASGKTETAQNAGKGAEKKGDPKDGETGKSQSDGSATETGKETSSDDKNTSDNKSETENSSNNNGETPTETTSTTTAVPTTSVDDTVFTVAATKLVQAEEDDLKRKKEEVPSYRREREAREAKRFAEKRTREREWERLFNECVNDLRNAFEKEADCEVNGVVPTSNRVVAGVTSADVMRLAANPKARVRCVTLNADGSETTGGLVALLHELGAKRKGERNPNVSFLLPNGTKFLSGRENVPGVKLETISVAVRITFPEATPGTSDTKKPDGKKTSGDTTGETKSETPDWMQAIWDNLEERKQTSRKYDGSFVPDRDGLLFDADLKSDLKEGYMTGDELIEGILKHNKDEKAKKEADQNPIVLVALCERDGSHPFARLSAAQTARAKGVIFVTDEAGAKEAEKDTTRFMTKKVGKCTFVFVLQDDGTLSQQQKKTAAELKLGTVIENPVSETADADGNRLTAEIVIPKDVTDAADEASVWSKIQGFVQTNPLCQLKVRRHYRDADALRNILSDACQNGNNLRLTFELQNPLPNNFAADVNAEAALYGLNVVTESNTTIRFKKVEIDEGAVKTYFERHNLVVLPADFECLYGVKDIMKFALNRTSDALLTLNMSIYAREEILNNLPGILKKIAEDENPKGLNLMIALNDLRDAEVLTATVNADLPDDKRHLVVDDAVGIVQFETAKEAYERQFGIAVNKNQLRVSDKIREDIKEARIDGSGLVERIRAYNTAFPELKISEVVTEDLKPDGAGTDGEDCIRFSPDDIKNLPEVTFILKDITRLDELKNAGLNVALYDEGRPYACLFVSSSGKPNEEGALENLAKFIRNTTGDIVLDKEQSKVFLENAGDLLNGDFFANHLGNKVTLDSSAGDCKDLRDFLKQRGLGWAEASGRFSFTAALMFPGLIFNDAPTIYRQNAYKADNWDPLGVRFTYALQPDECPKVIKDKLKNSDVILRAFCYLGKGGLKADCPMLLGFGAGIPQEVTQWTQKAFCMQNIEVTKNDGARVTRDDKGTSACLKFNIQNEDLEAGNAWFVCKYEVGEGDLKEEHRIAVHLFIAEEKPASVAFEEIEYPLGADDEEVADIRQNANQRCGELNGFICKALESELKSVPEPGENQVRTFAPQEDSPWTSYFRNGLISGADLAMTVAEYNEDHQNEKIEAIDLFNAGLYVEDEDITYFSKDDIRTLAGTAVFIYDTTREKEFKDAGLTCLKTTYTTEDGEHEQKHTALYVYEKQEEHEEEKENNNDEMKEGEEQGEQEEGKEGEGNDVNNEQEGQNEEADPNGQQEDEENNEGENEHEQEQQREQQQKKLTMELLKNPDDETKKLFAETDLKTFLDKAKTDLVGASEDPRNAEINLAELCAGNEALKSKIRLDVLLQYPLWRYLAVADAPEGEDKQTIWGAGITKDTVRNAKEQYKIALDLPDCSYFYALLALTPETDGKLTVGRNRDAEWLLQQSVRSFVDSVIHTLESGTAISVIDFCDNQIDLREAGSLKQLAPYPVRLSGLEMPINRKKGDNLWEIGKKGSGVMLIGEGNGTFKVRYEPERVTDCTRDRFLKNLKQGLITAAGTVANDPVKQAIDSLERRNFKYKPAGILRGGTAFDSEESFLSETNKKNLYDLVNTGKTGEDFVNRWQAFVRKLSRLDSQYYQSLIFFFLCWNGDERVDFSSFPDNEEEFLNWQNNLDINWKHGIEKFDIQTSWDECLEDAKNIIPHFDVVEQKFGALKNLLGSKTFFNEEIRTRLSDKQCIKNFLESIKDWTGWDENEKLFFSSIKAPSDDEKVVCFSLEAWELYQKLRFELYFVKGKTLPTSETDARKAMKQTDKTLRDFCHYTFRDPKTP